VPPVDNNWANILENSEASRPARMLTLSSLIQGQQQAPYKLRQSQQDVAMNDQKLQTGQMDIQQHQQMQHDQQALQQYLQQNPGKTLGDTADELGQSGRISFPTYQALKKADFDHREELAKYDESRLKNYQAGHTATQGVYDDLMRMNDQQIAQAWPQIAQKVRSIPGNEKLQLDSSQPMTRDQLSQFGPFVGMNGAYLAQEDARRKGEAETKKANAEASKAQMEADQGGTSDQARYTTTYLRSNNLPDTPQNRMKAFDDYNKKTKIQPAQIRVEGFGAIRQNPVFDSQTKQTVYMDSNSLNAANAREPGRYSVPGYTPEALGQKSTTEYFTKGKGGQQLTAFNTAIAHLGQMDQLADKLGNGDVQALNKFSQALSEATGNPVPAEFEAIRAALAGEVANTLKANGATDQEIHKVYDTFSRAQSASQLHGVASTYRGLLGSKRENLQQQYNAGMQGKPNFGGQNSSGEPTATGPGGHKIAFRNGRWVDAQTGAPIQ
jgi:hypothetical protein